MKVILHFGFPKTMSSTLQFGLFKPLHEKGVLNLKTWRQNDQNEHLDNRPSSRLFNGKDILDDSLDFQDDIINILSDESFTAPTRLRQNNYGNAIEDPSLFPEKIKEQITLKYVENIEFIPLIMIRNQADLIYSQYVEEYNLKKYKGIDILFDKKGEIDLKGFEIYNFYKYINILESTFGVGKINLFLFEEWQQNFTMCCAKLANLLEIEPILVEKLMSSSHVNEKKKSSEGYYTKDGSTLIPFLKPEQKSQIRTFFEADNLQLQKFIGPEIDLIKFKYL